MSLRMDTRMSDTELTMISVALSASAHVHNEYIEQTRKSLPDQVIDRITYGIFKELCPESSAVLLIQD